MTLVAPFCCAPDIPHTADPVARIARFLVKLVTRMLEVYRRIDRLERKDLSESETRDPAGGCGIVPTIMQETDASHVRVEGNGMERYRMEGNVPP
jgi:hypothetical protein